MLFALRFANNTNWKNKAEDSIVVLVQYLPLHHQTNLSENNITNYITARLKSQGS